jgi:hypothetical protein
METGRMMRTQMESGLNEPYRHQSQSKSADCPVFTLALFIQGIHPVFTLTLFIFPCPAFLYVQTLTMEQGDTGYYLQAARSLVELSTGTFRMRR